VFRFPNEGGGKSLAMNRPTMAALTAALTLVAAAPAAAARLSALDEHYIKSSISGDIFEITGGKIALSKSHNAKVRHLAATLVRDHTKSLHEALALASKLGVKPPDSAEPPQIWELAVTKAKHGRAFDKWYSALEISDHKQDISDAYEEAGQGSLKAVRKSAYKEIPTLRHHLALSVSAWKAA
jgi:putative membrane protein